MGAQTESSKKNTGTGSVDSDDKLHSLLVASRSISEMDEMEQSKSIALDSSTTMSSGTLQGQFSLYTSILNLFTKINQGSPGFGQFIQVSKAKLIGHSKLNNTKSSEEARSLSTRARFRCHTAGNFIHRIKLHSQHRPRLARIDRSLIPQNKDGPRSKKFSRSVVTSICGTSWSEPEITQSSSDEIALEPALSLKATGSSQSPTTKSTANISAGLFVHNSSYKNDNNELAIDLSEIIAEQQGVTSETEPVPSPQSITSVEMSSGQVVTTRSDLDPTLGSEEFDSARLLETPEDVVKESVTDGAAEAEQSADIGGPTQNTEKLTT